VNDAVDDRRGRRAVRRRAGAALAAVAIAGTACSSGHKGAASTTTGPSTTSTTAAVTTTTTVPVTYPLTGMAVTNKTQQASPAVVIKIDNVAQARPQTGLDYADVVYDAEVEGGLSRLAAVFQSAYPASVGPVRSGRLTDEGVADDLNHPVLAFSGTNGIFLPQLQAQPVTLITDTNHPEQFVRVGTNVPHNLFSNVADLAALSASHTAPKPLFTYVPAGQSFTGAGVAPAAGVSFAFPAAAVQWAWDGATGKWLRTQDGGPDVLTDGHQISATNVVIYFVPYITSGLATGEGVAPAPIPEGILTGTGNVWVFSSGHIVKGTWHRPDLTTPATYTDSTGQAIALTPGNTWVELAPVGTIPAITP
jgi:Protein of unknown function (DUF3048) N-terminal domain/Protein of unknown function (DUF3048) C-terminal domain